MSGTLQRAYVASKFALDLNGKPMGFLNSAEGGGLKTDIVDYKQGPIIDIWRQVGRPKFEDISLKLGMGMSPDFYNWIADFFNRKCTRMSGAIIAADFNYKERARRTFSEALISEITVPALDGSSKEAAFMTVKLVAEDMTYETKEKPGNRIDSPMGMKQTNKLWHAANFDFLIDGFEDACKRVMKMDQFQLKQQILEYNTGAQRRAIRVPARFEYPQSITIYVPRVDAAKFIEAAKKRILDYEAPPEGGMTGHLTFRAPDKAVLCTIDMYGLDVVSAEPQKLEASAETIYMVKVMLQVERMEFKYNTTP